MSERAGNLSRFCRSSGALRLLIEAYAPSSPSSLSVLSAGDLSQRNYDVSLPSFLPLTMKTIHFGRRIISTFSFGTTCASVRRLDLSFAPFEMEIETKMTKYFHIPRTSGHNAARS